MSGPKYSNMNIYKWFPPIYQLAKFTTRTCASRTFLSLARFQSTPERPCMNRVRWRYVYIVSYLKPLRLLQRAQLWPSEQDWLVQTAAKWFRQSLFFSSLIKKKKKGGVPCLDFPNLWRGYLILMLETLQIYRSLALWYSNIVCVLLGERWDIYSQTQQTLHWACALWEQSQ